MERPDGDLRGTVPAGTFNPPARSHVMSAASPPTPPDPAATQLIRTLIARAAASTDAVLARMLMLQIGRDERLFTTADREGLTKALDLALAVGERDRALVVRLATALLAAMRSETGLRGAGPFPARRAPHEVEAALVRHWKDERTRERLQAVIRNPAAEPTLRRGEGVRGAHGEMDVLRGLVEHEVREALIAENLQATRAIVRAWSEESGEQSATWILGASDAALRTAGRLARALRAIGTTASDPLLICHGREIRAEDLVRLGWERLADPMVKDAHHWWVRNRFRLSGGSGPAFGGAGVVREHVRRILSAPDALIEGLRGAQGVEANLLISADGLSELAAGGRGGELLVLDGGPSSAPGSRRPGAVPGPTYLALRWRALYRDRPFQITVFSVGTAQSPELQRRLGEAHPRDLARERIGREGLRTLSIWDPKDRPLHEIGSPCDLLGPPASARCDHPAGHWVLTESADTLLLCCTTCGLAGLDAVPAHRLRRNDPLSPAGLDRLDEPAYLRRQRFHQALAGDARPVLSLRQLRARDGLLALTPSGAVTAPAPAARGGGFRVALGGSSRFA